MPCFLWIFLGAPFVERLVHFWSNHFAVSVDKLLVVGLAGGFEADAIRPHVLGRFEDLLLAVVASLRRVHPYFLDDVGLVLQHIERGDEGGCCWLRAFSGR